MVAPLWSVKDTIANEIAIDFHTNASQHKAVPFSEILRLQRAKAYDPETAEDSYAAYCFFGDPFAVPARPRLTAWPEVIQDPEKFAFLVDIRKTHKERELPKV